MAPSYRNANRRQNRPGVDHGEYEGIPVRHWRRDLVTVAPPPITDSSTSQSDIWAVELPHGMPKDSHLLPQHSQDLLRAARSGRIYKHPAPADEEEPDPEAIITDKPEKKDEDLKEKGFTAKSWKQVARHLEGPDVVYLAKRRKGLVTAASKPLPVPTVTKATVKRIDAAGNEYVQDIVVPRGQVVEGEVISQTQIPDPNAPVGLAQVQATPPRPRPKSKKKAKGPGRGRKKKPAAPTSAPQAPVAEGVAHLLATEGTAGSDVVNAEDQANPMPALDNEDTEMGDGSAANSDDDDGDDGEDGDEGDEDEGSVDIQDSPSKPSQQSPLAASKPTLPPVPPVDQNDVPMGETEFPHAPSRLLSDRFEAKSGSPLKHVAMTTSTLNSPLEPPAASSPTKAFPGIHPLASEVTPMESKLKKLDEEMQQEVPGLAPEALPLPPPGLTVTETVAAVVERVEEEEEEQMLLDGIDRARNAEVGAPLQESAADPFPRVEAEVESTKSRPWPETEEAIPEAAPVSAPEASSEVPIQAIPAEDDDDEYPDLLGDLEKSLKTPEARAQTPVGVPVSVSVATLETAKDLEKVGVEEEDEEKRVAEEAAKEDELNSQDSEMLL